MSFKMFTPNLIEFAPQAIHPETLTAFQQSKQVQSTHYLKHVKITMFYIVTKPKAFTYNFHFSI